MLSAPLIVSSCDQSRRTDLDNGNGAATGKEILVEGQEFAKISLSNLEGKTVTLESLQGKLVLVNFWATWCAPCISEMPALERLYQTFRTRGLEIVAISVDSPKSIDKVREFVKKSGLSFPILLDPELSLPPSLGITGFPETFFVGPDGKLLSFPDPDSKRNSVRTISDRAWDSPVYLQAISELLKQNNL